MKFVSIKTKILMLVIIAVAVTALALVGIVLQQRGPLAGKVNEELMVLARNETSKIAQNVYQMCQVMEDQLQLQVEASLKVSMDHVNRYGGIRVAGNGTGSAVSASGNGQPAGTASAGDTASLLLGGKPIEIVKDPNVRVPVVDDVQEQLGAMCSIFQRVNEQGDMLRVASSVISDGQRVVGSTISATGDDGRNPVIAAVVAGTEYQGVASVLGEPSLTAYTPLKDASGEVIGMVGTAIAIEKVDSLRQGIMDIVVGKTGYVFVLGGSGDHKGEYIISADGSRDGEDILDAKDEDGNEFIKELISKATQTSDGSVEYERYSWLNNETGKVEPKITAVTYFEPWDWVIGAGTYESDFQTALGRVSNAIWSMILIVLIAAVIIVIIATFIAFMQSSRIANPLIKATAMANAVAQGDLSQSLELKQNDEVGQLVEALNSMNSKLRNLVSKISEAAMHVASNSEQLAASSNETSRAVQVVAQRVDDVSRASYDTTNSAQNAQTTLNQTATAIEGISKDIEEVASFANQASAQGESGQSATEEAAGIINEAANSVKSTMNIVQTLGEKTRKISEFISIITGIADQTNLLALNAAIEAARAGEAGRGFAVVAEEVRKLAEESNTAAGNITELVKGIEVEMDQALEAMSESQDRVVKGNETMTDASNLLQQIVGGFAQLNERVQNISAAAQQINASTDEVVTSMADVLRSTEENSKSTQEVSAATEEQTAAMEEIGASAQRMAEMSTELQAVVEQFRL
jgi:methyl-accepting chemotaxis protein